MELRPKAKLLTPELARQLLHNADFYIGLKREALKRHGNRHDRDALDKYELEAQMLRNYLKEHENGHN